MSNSDKLNLVHGSASNSGSQGAAGYIPSNAALCIPELVLQDAGAGVGDFQSSTTAYPAPIDQASTWDRSLQTRFGSELGAEAWHKGANVMLAPAVNIARTPLNGRNYEYFGEDPYLAGRTAVAEINGIQSNPVIATVKHYAANNQEASQYTTSANVDARTLHEIYLPAFGAAVAQGHVGGVMCSYNLINDIYSCEDPATLTGVLRKEWGFTGLVVSDWTLGTRSTLAAAKAGLDIEMPTGMFFGAPLNAAIFSGQVPMTLLDQMVLNILSPMFRLGLFDHPPAEGPQLRTLDVRTAAHNKTALTMAEEGTVLLKNDGELLPLTGSGATIAVIGRPASPDGTEGAYGGGGSSHVPWSKSGGASAVAPITAIQQMAGSHRDHVVYDDGAEPTRAAVVARSASVAIVFADDAETEGEDKPNLSLRAGDCGIACTYYSTNQDQLIASVAKANPHTVVVLDSGGPILMPWLGQVQGVLEAWYPGQGDGSAIAAVLFGAVNPSGKLPETFPVSESQLPTSTPEQYPGVNGQEAYSEGLLVGYRWYDAKSIKPLFPFGYGLSYTSFSLAGLSVGPLSGGGVHVSFTVRNTGKRLGAEVAQVYVGDPQSTGEPPRQLKGYERVVLRPGQTKTVTLTVDRQSFSHWDTTTSTWQVTPACYALMIGTSSVDLPLHADVSQGGARCPT
jgi:beta-glucosidase